MSPLDTTPTGPTPPEPESTPPEANQNPTPDTTPQQETTSQQEAGTQPPQTRPEARAREHDASGTADRDDPPNARDQDAADAEAPAHSSLPGPNPEPEHAGTPAETWSRVRSALSLRSWRPQLLAGVLCALLGFAIVAQVQHTDESGLSELSETELIRVLDDVDDRNERLEAEAAQLARDEEELLSGSDQREAAREQAADRAEALSVLAGTVPVTGPGVEITITGSEGVVTAGNLVTFVHELRDAGAEAIEFGDTRVVVDTYFAEDDGGLLINGDRLPLPLMITAIGEPETMATAMRIPGGVADTIDQRGGDLTVETRAQVDIDSVVPPETGGRASEES